jgi:predicted ATPase
MWSKGYAAEEAKAAYARAGELAMEIGNAEAPFDAYYGWLGHALFRGELGTARETAESFLREAERVGRATEVGVGHRILGSTCLLQGDFAQARAHLEEALRIYVPERDREAKFRFGLDSRVAATTYLAYLAWFFGDARRARELTDEAAARAAESAHAPTLANAYFFEAALAILRDDALAARRAAEAGAALSREHGLALYLTLGAILSALTDAKFVDRDRGATELRKLLADYARRGYKIQLPFLQGLLAEIEAARGGAEAALGGIDEALALAGETGEHWSDAALHRIRGEILLEHNEPSSTSPPAARSTPMTSWGRRWQAFRQRRNFRRSPRRGRCSRRSPETRG